MGSRTTATSDDDVETLINLAAGLLEAKQGQTMMVSELCDHLYTALGKEVCKAIFIRASGASNSGRAGGSAVVKCLQARPDRFSVTRLNQPPPWVTLVSNHSDDAKAATDEAEERRVDTDGVAYTRTEFVEEYGGTAEWEAAWRLEKESSRRIRGRGKKETTTSKARAATKAVAREDAVAVLKDAGSSDGVSDRTSSDDLAVLLYYHFTPIADCALECERHRSLCEWLQLQGRLRIAPQGLNGTLSGTRVALGAYERTMSAQHSGIDWKYSSSWFKTPSAV